VLAQWTVTGRLSHMLCTTSEQEQITFRLTVASEELCQRWVNIAFADIDV